MDIEWATLFEHWGSKQVTKTDKLKAAYVPTVAQVRAIEAAGIAPSSERPATPIQVAVLFEARSAVTASYYHSMRDEPGRGPEPRLGRELISDWLEIGDTLVIGSIGRQLFAARQETGLLPDSVAAASFVRAANKASRAAIVLRAKRAKGKPRKRIVSRTEFDRDPNVILAALIRADGKCETPRCDRQLFHRDNGDLYLEVHHVHPLGEGGDDTLENVAALCPHCHRELHFGKRRNEQRRVLAARIASLDF